MNEQVFQVVLLILGTLGTIVNAFAALAWWALRQEVKHVKELLTLEVEQVKAEVAGIKAHCDLHQCGFRVDSLHGQKRASL